MHARVCFVMPLPACRLALCTPGMSARSTYSVSRSMKSTGMVLQGEGAVRRAYSPPRGAPADGGKGRLCLLYIIHNRKNGAPWGGK